MLRRILPLLFAVVFAASAQTEKYDGPVPPKPDLPYIKQADNLIPTEALEAKEEKGKKNATTYIIAGANSPARTPLAEPTFIIRVDKLNPDQLSLYKLESRNGQREIVFEPKHPPQAHRVDVTRLSGGLYKIEVDDTLDPGEYSLSPEGSNQVFCFQVF